MSENLRPTGFIWLDEPLRIREKVRLAEIAHEAKGDRLRALVTDLLEEAMRPPVGVYATEPADHEG